MELILRGDEREGEGRVMVRNIDTIFWIGEKGRERKEEEVKS